MENSNINRCYLYEPDWGRNFVTNIITFLLNKTMYVLLLVYCVGSVPNVVVKSD